MFGALTNSLGDIKSSTGAGITADEVAVLTNKTINDYSNTVHADALHFRIKATENINKGQPVKFTGYNAGENAIEVALANQSTGVSNGLAEEDLLIGEFGMVIQSGLLEGVDTTLFVKGAGYAAEGDILYVDGTGQLIGDQPTTGFMQPIAFILRSHAINGALQVNADYPKQDALDVRFTPYGSITSTEVQSAIEELDDAVASAGAFSTTSNVTSNSNGTLSTDDFVFGSDSLIDDGNVDHDKRFLFKKSTGAFAAGISEGTQWNVIGAGSAVFGKNCSASALYCGVFGDSCTGSGNRSLLTGTGVYTSGEQLIAVGNNMRATGYIGNSFGRLYENNKQYSLSLGYGSATTDASPTGLVRLHVDVDQDDTKKAAIELSSSAGATTATNLLENRSSVLYFNGSSVSHSDAGTF